MRGTMKAGAVAIAMVTLDDMQEMKYPVNKKFQNFEYFANGHVD
jgi:hypothetical protein